MAVIPERRLALLGGGFSTDDDGLLDDWVLDQKCRGRGRWRPRRRAPRGGDRHGSVPDAAQHVPVHQHEAIQFIAQGSGGAIVNIASTNAIQPAEGTAPTTPPRRAS